MTQQTPLNTCLEHATSEAVLRGRDLTGQTAVVTGAGSGLGRHTAAMLAAHGAHVIAPVRSPATARARLQEADVDLARVTLLACDLADVTGVRRVADDVRGRWRRLDLVVCAAGIMATPHTLVGPGWESQFATNHLGHRAMLDGIIPALAAGGARVVLYSSLGHHTSNIRWHDLHFTRGYDKWAAYGQSKTAAVLTAVHLDAIGREHGIRAFALHPGKIMTGLQRDLTRAEQVSQGWVDDAGTLIADDFSTVDQGAATGLWAATSPDLDGLGGLYLERCDVAPLAGPGDVGVRGVMPYAVDPAAAARLWALSSALLSRPAGRS